MWLPLAAITLTTLCVVAVSGDTVRQPMQVDARPGNAQQDVIGTGPEKDPAKKSTGDSPHMDMLPVQRPKGISGRIKAALQRRLAAVGDGGHRGPGRMHRLADRMVGFVKSHLQGGALERMVEDVPDTADHPAPEKKLQDLGENINNNWLNHMFKDTKGED